VKIKTISPIKHIDLLGYRKGDDGQPEIVPEEAEIIKTIFNNRYTRRNRTT
jgi:hypothetical protein